MDDRLSENGHGPSRINPFVWLAYCPTLNVRCFISVDTPPAGLDDAILLDRS